MVQIFGTLGPACSDTETLTRLFAAGMTGVRLNLSHVGLDGAAEQIEHLHAAARSRGVTPQLLIDMQGSIRARSSGWARFQPPWSWRTEPLSAWEGTSPCPPLSCHI